MDQNISQLECTRIVIAHRLSTIQNADLILLLSEGTIVERGSHDELIEQDGLYAKMVRQQYMNPVAATLCDWTEDRLPAGVDLRFSKR